MPVLAALATALPYVAAAWQVGSQYLNKPKKEDYVPHGAAYTRYLDHLKSQTTESRTFHQRMRPALRQIGQQTRRGQREVEKFTARRKPGGGVEAQMRMGLNQQALEAIGVASEKASIAQEQVNERTGERLMMIGIQEERALQRFDRAKRQWSKDMVRTTVSAGINLASTAVQQHLVKAKAAAEAAATTDELQATLVEQFETAKAEGYIGQDAKLTEYTDAVETAGYENPDMYNKYMGIQKTQKVKDIKAVESAETDRITASSTQAATQAYKLIGDNPDGALEMLEEIGYFRYMTDKDILAVTKKAISEAPKPMDPLDKKITMASVTHDLKGLKALLPEVYKFGTTKQIEKASKAYDLELKNEAERIEEGDEAAQELLVLKNDLNVFQATLGMYQATYPDYKEGVNEDGKKWSKIGKDAFEKTITTLGAINFDRKGYGASVAKGVNRSIKTWLTALKVDDTASGNLIINAVQTNDTELLGKIANAEADEKVNGVSVGIRASRAASLYIQLLNRNTALFEGKPYDDYEDILNGLRQ